MITGYSFKNYRAFESGSIAIRPITILLGSNGIGKTSIMQVPLLLQQTAQAANTRSRSVIKLHGRTVSLGDVANIFRNKTFRRPVELSFSFRSHDLFMEFRNRILQDMRSATLEVVQYISYVSERFSLETQGPRKPDDPRLNNVFIHGRRRQHEPEGPFRELLDDLSRQLEGVKQLGNDQLLQEIANVVPRLLPRRSRFGTFRMRGQESFDLDGLSRLATLVEAVKESITPRFELRCEFRGRARSDRLSISKIELLNSGRSILAVSFEAQNQVRQVTSEFVPDLADSQVLDDLTKIVAKDATLFRLFSTEVTTGSHIADFVRSIFNQALRQLEKDFDQEHLVHVGPLRAYPRRYYFFDGAAGSTLGGDGIVESLRENEELRSRVNSWLQRFGLSVAIGQYQELIHKISVQRDNVGFALDIPDVGFGISQILPVIVESYMAKPGAIVMIEQPEIHLHPKMQADLADLFIDASKNTGKKETTRFIIETHSEYLLNRLRRRIAEGTIQAEDVAIYSIQMNNEEKTSELVRVPVDSAGDFTWPNDFFEADLNDTVAFLIAKKAQVKG